MWRAVRGQIASDDRRTRTTPVYFGSALKLEAEEFLDGLETFTREREWPAAFAARVFKIAHDGQQ